MGTHLKIALRTLYREKLYALINIAGLALAIGCCLILTLYLRNELTYDQHHLNHERIYRLVNEFNIGGAEDTFAVTSVVIGEMLTEAYPEVQDYTRFRPANAGGGEFLMRHEDDAYYWEGAYFADDNVFDVFTHDIIYGDPETALTDPSSIAVSETFAERYFGDANVIGETLTADTGSIWTITLVFAGLPENTHMKYDVLLSSNSPLLQTPENMRRNALFNVGLFTYLVMDEDYDVQDWNAISQDFFDTNMSTVAQNIDTTWRSWLQPLEEIHLNSDVGYDFPTGNRYYIYGFAAVAAFILLVACINYVNLATARATKRTRSVGMRKILGSSRGSLIAQFIGEAVLFALIAAVLGVVLVEVVLTLSPIESLIGTQLSLDLLAEPGLTAAILGVSVAVGALSGLYPALYLSSWAPLTALVGENRASKGQVLFRQGLVFLQFTISIAVIASTLLMASQMRYIGDRPLGFGKENRVVITLRGADLIEQVPTIINELSTDSRILGVTTSTTIMGELFPINLAQVDNNEGVQQPTTINHMPVGENFLDVMNMPVVQGRDFSRRLLTDVGATYVVNQTFVRNMGWDDPIGKRIGLGGAGINSGRVIGVVSDFNFQSLHTPIGPFALYPFNDSNLADMSELQRSIMTRRMIVNISGEEIGGTLRLLEDTFAKFDPTHPFEYAFLDDSLNELYASEQNLMSLLGVFAGICILIACLGLFGLASFTTEQRTKEIGIRKVLGATASQIVWLLSRNILMLIVGGAVVASLVAFLTIDEWLAGFAYRAPINPLVFVASTVAAAAVAFVTIALQSYGTVREDPVDALRYE